MADKSQFQLVGENVWEIGRKADSRMRVPARILGTEKILRSALKDRSVEQLLNVAMLPGIVKYAIAMPDIHQGYGFPIGGVAAFDVDDGVVSPGGVGYDINCGVRMLASAIAEEELLPHLSDLVDTLFANCPTGVGGKGAVRLSRSQLVDVLEQGSRWALANGYARREDLESTESLGTIPGAHAKDVPERAIERGIPQLGSLGSGNHFLEIDIVRDIYDAQIAQAFGLWQNQVVVQIHCGSRGLGHEVCGSYLRVLMDSQAARRLDIPDRELVAAPVKSPEGKQYLSAMAAAANYAFANRQVLTALVRQSFEQVMARYVRDWDLDQIYDVTHNIAKFEEHAISGRQQKLLVHRKGATRAFPAGSSELHSRYRETGQPVLVPGSMGTSSYVVVGTPQGLSATFASSCHGAGRAMSRRQALKTTRGEKVQANLRHRGIIVQSRSMRGIAEEAPLAYKDVDEVVAAMVGTGYVRKIARVFPLAVIKG
ncbi:MAG: RtcB family protein [Anaerolineae bacterium]|nr:RtcB family protein [Anaerolineae bacterium]